MLSILVTGDEGVSLRYRAARPDKCGAIGAGRGPGHCAHLVVIVVAEVAKRSCWGVGVLKWSGAVSTKRISCCIMRPRRASSRAVDL
jgi:hypothetical protein